VKEGDDEDDSEDGKKGRKPASAGSNKFFYGQYRSGPEDLDLHSHWVKKVVGGESVGERILYPDKYYGRTQKVKIEVLDPAQKELQKMNQKIQQREDIEKRKLIEELSRIHID
jgi:hypothetical protein